MRRILVENSRRKTADKHGGDFHRIDAKHIEAVAGAAPEDLVALDELLDRLAANDPTAGQLFKLRYFAGLSVEEAAEALGLSRSAAYRLWAFVRAWLRCEIAGNQLSR